MTRKRVAAKVHNDLMVANKRMCCICQEPGQQVVLHHIDGDPSNSTRENLAVLCLRCHGRVEGDEGLGRRYSPDEVYAHKKNWEATVEARRTAGLRVGRPIGWWRQVKANFYCSSYTPVAPAELCDGCGHDVQYRSIHRLTAELSNGTVVTEQFCSPCLEERGRVPMEPVNGVADQTRNPTRVEYVRAVWLASGRLGSAVVHSLRAEGFDVDHVGWGLGGGGLLTPLIKTNGGKLVEAEPLSLTDLNPEDLRDSQFIDLLTTRVRKCLKCTTSQEEKGSRR